MFADFLQALFMLKKEKCNILHFEEGLKKSDFTAKKLKEARNAANLSQEQVAKVLGISIPESIAWMSESFY